MAILNFPNTTGQPTDGSFTYLDNGVLYSWDGSKWTANTEPGFDTRYVEVTGDTMTGDLTVPNLIATSDVSAVDVNASGDVSADNVVATGDIQSTSQNGGQLAGLRNQLINGDFCVAQRTTSLTSGNGYKTCDRWYQ